MMTTQVNDLVDQFPLSLSSVMMMGENSRGEPEGVLPLSRPDLHQNPSFSMCCSHEGRHMQRVDADATE